MRAAPPFQVSLQRFGVWRVAIAVIAALGLSSIAAWAFTREEPPAALVWFVVLASESAILALAWSLARVPATRLRWDGLCWHLGAPHLRHLDMVAGDVRPMIDLGPWMLIRFIPTTRRGRWPTAIWLPAQRRGIEGQWHALRCAIYSPRPAPTFESLTGP